MKEVDKQTLIEEEAFVVLHSGEIPEVTFHEALYHLTEDPDGPCLILEAEDLLPLKYAVVARYRAIILRDLDPENRNKGFYRGLARCSVNWKRMEEFCARERIDFSVIRIETADALKEFLNNELGDVQSGRCNSCINCSDKEIEELAESLGFSVGDLSEGWQELCPD